MRLKAKNLSLTKEIHILLMLKKMQDEIIHKLSHKTNPLLKKLVEKKVDLEIYITVMALVGFSASAVQALAYQNGDYMGSLNKKASGAQCFIMALGLFWDIVTGLPWTPNGVGSLEPRGYCIFLPGAHYLTINSTYGADSSLNKLLLLLLLKIFEFCNDRSLYLM